MGDGSLSQEEIDALLTGAEDDAPAAPVSTAPPPQARGASSGQYSFLTSNLSEAMGMASNSAAAIVGKEIRFTNASSSGLPSGSMAAQIENQSVVASANLGSVPAIMVFTPQQAKKIAMHVMGAGSEPAEFDEAHISSINELSSTILSAVSNHLGPKFSDNLSPSNTAVKVFSGAADIPNFSSPNAVKVSFDLSIDNAPMGSFIIFIDESGPNKWSQDNSQSFVGENMDMGGMSDMELNIGGNQMSANMGGDPQGGFSETSRTMNPVSFPTFQAGGTPTGVPSNYDLLLDVQMVLTVELGRTTKYVKDVLKLGEGSIIELDKLAGEPVDLLINGKLIAKGEVVVIDENFGVRVTDIVAPAERLAQIAAST